MTFETIIGNLFGEYGFYGVGMALLALALFCVQFWYYAVRYGKITRVKELRAAETAEAAALSVVVVLNDSNYHFLEETLPLILSQEGVTVEAVVVDLSGDVDFSEALKLAAVRDSRITITYLPVNPLFPISNKMAVNMGIKAAHNENIVLTSTDIIVPGPHWLARMAAGFGASTIVLGYSAPEEKRGESNMLIRMGNLGMGMKWLSAALCGKTYRGTEKNLGFTRAVYFGNQGFNHLNLNIGEDDLFVQYIMGSASSTVVLDKGSIVRYRLYGGAAEWHRRRLLRSNAFKYYPADTRRYIGLELWTRELFFACCILMAILLPFEMKIAAGGLLLVRFIIVFIQTIRIGHRLGEKRVWPVIPVYDIASPVYEAAIAIARRIKRTPGLWR